MHKLTILLVLTLFVTALSVFVALFVGLVELTQILLQILHLHGPVFDAVAPIELANWLLASGLQVRMQLQLHKYIWDPQARGV